MNKDEICKKILSLENEIEFMKEFKQPTIEKKKELKKLYSQLKNISRLSKKEEEDV
jgi:hypothetical protein